MLMDKVLKNNYVVLPLILVLHLLLLFLNKFTAWPEILTWPYLILKGWLPYRDIGIAHTPLLIVTLSLFYKLVGIGLLQLKFVTWVIVAISDILVFRVADKLWGKKTAVLSLLLYIPLQLFYEGNSLWFDLALTPLIISLYYFAKKQNYFLVGIFWALAYLTKQTAVWFMIPTIMYTQGLALKGITKTAVNIILGILIVFIPFALLLISFHLIDDFYFWAIKFALGVLPQATGQVILPDLLQLAKSYLVFLPLVFTPELLVWAIAGSLSAFPRWEMFHFQPALPFVAFAIARIFVKHQSGKQKSAVYFVLILFAPFLIRTYIRDFQRPSRFYEPEVKKVAEYVKSKVTFNEKIVVLNSWDHFYVLTDTLPAYRPWIPQLSWYLQEDSIERQMYMDIEYSKPKLIILSPYKNSGLGSYKSYFTDELLNNYVTTYKTENFEVLQLK